MWQSQTAHIWRQDECATRAGYLSLQADIQNKKYSLLFHSKNGYTNAPRFLVYTHVAYHVIPELVLGIRIY